MTGDGATPVFCPEIPFDCREHETSEKACEADHEGHRRRLPGIKRGRPPEAGADEHGRANASDRALPGFVWTDAGRDGPLPAGLAPHILQDVAELHRQDKEEEQIGVFSLIAGNRQGKNHRHVADRVDTDEQGPLDAGRAHEEVLCLAGEDAAEGDENKGVNGNEDREHPVPMNADQKIVQWQDDKERPEKDLMIGSFSSVQGDELPHREEGKHREKHGRENRAEQNRGAENCRHDPPRAYPRVQVRDGAA